MDHDMFGQRKLLVDLIKYVDKVNLLIIPIYSIPGYKNIFIPRI